MSQQTLIAIAPEALIILIFAALILLITWRRRPRNTKLRDMRPLFGGIALVAIILLLASLYFAPPPTDLSEHPSEIPTEFPIIGANP